MSLTSELRSKDSFARTFIDREFPHLQALSIEINKSLRCFDAIEHTKHPDPHTYSIIGTAADYRIRSFYTNAPYRGHIVESGLRGFESIHSIETLDDYIENRFHGRSSDNGLAAEFKKFSEHFFSKLAPARRALKSKQEERLCRYCILLARITHARRSFDYSYFYDAMKSGKLNIDKFMNAVDQQWVDDMAVLASSYYHSNAKVIRTFSNIFHGNVLTGSRDIGGADFDLVVDGCLVDIKTTIKAKITTEYLRQILGYWLLDYYDKFKICSASVYLTRQAYEQRFDIEVDLLQTKRSKRDLRRLFRDGLRKTHV